MLAANFEMQIFREGDPGERTRLQFLASRAIRRNAQEIWVPFVELANHSVNGIRFGAEPLGNLQLAGKAQGEIFLDYGPLDPLGTFRKFVVAAALPQAFSLPLKTNVGTRSLTILRNTPVKRKGAGFDMPELWSKSGELFLSHMMIGNSKFPGASRGIFCSLMRDAGASAADEAFDRVLHRNKVRFLGLLGALEPLQGEMVTRLRRMVHLQLEAMAHCVGTRAY